MRSRRPVHNGEADLDTPRFRVVSTDIGCIGRPRRGFAPIDQACRPAFRGGLTRGVVAVSNVCVSGPAGSAFAATAARLFLEDGRDASDYGQRPLETPWPHGHSRVSPALVKKAEKRDAELNPISVMSVHRLSDMSQMASQLVSTADLKRGQMDGRLGRLGWTLTKPEPDPGSRLCI